MRAVVQRVSRAQVTVNGEITDEIGQGLLVLLGVGRDDTEADAACLAEKIAGLRVFEDDNGKMNRGVRTLAAVCRVPHFSRSLREVGLLADSPKWVVVET
jgi:D-tyrosyl-tRNA(Tyr) deacylase